METKSKATALADSFDYRGFVDLQQLQIDLLVGEYVRSTVANEMIHSLCTGVPNLPNTFPVFPREYGVFFLKRDAEEVDDMGERRLRFSVHPHDGSEPGAPERMACVIDERVKRKLYSKLNGATSEPSEIEVDDVVTNEEVERLKRKQYFREEFDLMSRLATERIVSESYGLVGTEWFDDRAEQETCTNGLKS